MGESKEVKPIETSGCWEVADKNDCSVDTHCWAELHRSERNMGGLGSSVAESRFRHV